MNITDLDEHKSIEQLKRDVVSLKRENRAAMLTIDKLLKDLNKKTEEIQHLQSLVSQTVPVVKKSGPAVVVAEDEIAELQLERLRLAAQGRTLTLEEVRMFDLLVKNKHLGREKSSNSPKSHYRDVTDIELLKLAAKEVKPSDEPDAE